MTSQAGSTDFSSKRNWALVPEIPQKMAEASAMVRPENLEEEGTGFIKQSLTRRYLIRGRFEGEDQHLLIFFALLNFPSAMNPDLTFRLANPQDEEKIWQVIEPIIRQGGTYVFDPATSKEKMMDYWLHADKKTYVALAGGSLAGTFYLKENQPDLGNHICNAGFMVAPQFGGKGIGQTMGRFAMQEAKKLGFQAMQFNFVIQSNSKAVALWQNLGFRILGEIPQAYRHPKLGFVPALIMYQEL